MKEEWKDIFFIENDIEYDYRGLYQVSNLGKIKSLGNGMTHNSKTKILKGYTLNTGYVQVKLCKNGKTKHFSIHRLVAYMFIVNPNNYAIVNHKDENRSNNNVDNLEWCTHEYNMNYGNIKKKQKDKLMGRKLENSHKMKIGEKNSIGIVGINIIDNTMLSFKSATDAGRNGFNQSQITQCCLINLLGFEEYLKNRKYPRKTSIHKKYNWFYEDDYKKKFVK